MKTERRTALKKMFASLIGVAGLGMAANAGTKSSEKKPALEKEVGGSLTMHENLPLYNGFTKLGNMVFLSGIGCHDKNPDIGHQVGVVLGDLEKRLVEAGSNMNQVLKVNVYLNDIADYKGLNDAYAGHFGDNPPVRTTVAVAKGGVPGDSLVEIDCIAYVK